MIGYVTLGTNDREKSSKFYDALCGELGSGRQAPANHSITQTEETPKPVRDHSLSQKSFSREKKLI